MELTSLPDEVQEHILSYLSVINELFIASQVCRLWRKMCVDLYNFKHYTFNTESQKGNFAWRLCGDIKFPGGKSMHFLPKHSRACVTVSDLNIPSPRICHEATFFEKNIYVYGGENSQKTSYFNDLFGYNVLTSKWRKIMAKGCPPTPRSTFSLTRNSDNIFITGGRIGFSRSSGIGVNAVIFDDVYRYNITENAWYKSGVLNNKRFGHKSTCLQSSSLIKLVLVGGMGAMHDLSGKIEICSIVPGSNTISSSMLIDFHECRIGHSQAKLDETHILIYGGCTRYPDDDTLYYRNDAWLLKFNESYNEIDFIPITVRDINVYNGLYPFVANDFVHIKDFLIYFQKSHFIKESLDHPHHFVKDADRKPSGDAIYRQDYYYTFILNISDVMATHAMSWQQVLTNPPKLAPRNSTYHKTILAGDSVYVFGGSVHDRRRKQSDSNNLYKINVFRKVER